MSQWFQRLRANAKYGAVSDATIQGYLRAASQIEEVWQQIDDKVNELILQGQPPWEAYSSMGYALAFIRACRMNVIFVQELLQAETTGTGGSANAGRLPKITYEQALALCEHIEPDIEEAIKASTNPRYSLPSTTLPLVLGPHVGYGYQSPPLSHLRGMIVAGQEMKDWTAGLLAKYELALHAAQAAIPAEVSAHLEQMKSELELGNFHLRTGIDMIGQISQGSVAEELGRKAEGLLWEAMESFYRVSQLIAMPGVRRRAAQPAPVESSQGRVAPQPAPRQPVPEAVVPPQPDINPMLNQVIAEREPARPAPSQPSSEAISLLNQMNAGSQSEHSEPARAVPDVAGLLGQETTMPAGPALDTGNLLSQGSAREASSRPPAKPARASGHDAHPRKDPPAENTLDLLSEICGEQKEAHE